MRICQSLIVPAQFTLTPGNFILGFGCLHQLCSNLRINLLRLNSSQLTILCFRFGSTLVNSIVFSLKDLSIVIFMLGVLIGAVKASSTHADLAVAYFERIPNGIRNFQKIHYNINSFQDDGAPEDRVEKKLNKYCFDFNLFLRIFIVLNIV